MVNYEILPNGVIKQKKILNKLQIYDIEYINQRYNTYGIKNHQISGLRLGYLIASIGRIPNSILDVGYGNGDFLSLCKDYIKECYGNDISMYPLSDEIIFVDDITKKHYDVICFFDVLEHFEDISIIKNLKCNYIFISVPWCHNTNEEWFMNWKHRRPDEHLWHFNEKSIVNFFSEHDFTLINYSNVEDVIRIGKKDESNILTCIFKKQTKYGNNSDE